MSHNPRSVRLIATDLDGTLLDSHQQVSPANLAALVESQHAGVKVVIATARGPKALPAVLKQLTGPGGDGLRPPVDVIASQGAICGHWTGAKLIIDQAFPMPRAVALEVAAHGLAAGCSVSWHAGHDWFSASMDAATKQESMIVGAKPGIVASLSDFPGEPEKITLINHQFRPGDLAQLGAQLPNQVHGRSSHPAFLDVTLAGVDKAGSLIRLAQKQGITPEEILAIGDGDNDVEMLACAGYSAAPSNASREALNTANLTAPSNDADAVAWVLAELRS